MPRSTSSSRTASSGSAPTIKRQPDLDRLMSHPLCVPVTDGMARIPCGIATSASCPRRFGSFPLVLGSYVRDAGVMSLEAGRPPDDRRAGRRVGLTDRGRLAPGLAADLVLFDPAIIANRATEADPAARPAGIARVMVNGSWAVVDGAATGERGGRML